MNPYLTKDNKASETLQYTLDYYGISIEEFKAMSDEQIKQMVSKFSDVLNDGKVRKSGDLLPGHKRGTGINCGGGGIIRNQYGGDSGSFSRYFSLDSWWDKKLAELPESVRRTFPFLIVPKASKSEKNKGCEGLKGKYKDIGTSAGHGNHNPVCQSCSGSKIDRGGGVCNCSNPKWKAENKTHKNNHPTCKPVKLMSYLITLGSRKGDIVLDPFIGSGTTAVAVKILKRKYIGYELDAEYLKIANCRIGAVENTLF